MDSGLTVLSGPHVCQALYQALRALTAQRSSGPHVERLSSRCAPHTISTYASCCGLRRDRMEAISLSGPGTHPWSPPPPGTTKLACPLPHSHTITRQARSRAKRRRPRMAASTRAQDASTRTCECTCSSTTTVTARSPVTSPPTRVTATDNICAAQPIPLKSLWPSKAEPAAHPSYIPLAPKGRASSPTLLHPSGPRRQSQQPIPLTSLWSSKAEPAAHPSYIPLAPEGRASADSQAYASYCIRLSSQ